MRSAQLHCPSRYVGLKMPGTNYEERKVMLCMTAFAVAFSEDLRRQSCVTSGAFAKSSRAFEESSCHAMPFMTLRGL